MHRSLYVMNYPGSSSETEGPAYTNRRGKPYTTRIGPSHAFAGRRSRTRRTSSSSDDAAGLYERPNYLPVAKRIPSQSRMGVGTGAGAHQAALPQAAASAAQGVGAPPRAFWLPMPMTESWVQAVAQATASAVVNASRAAPGQAPPANAAPTIGDDDGSSGIEKEAVLRALSRARRRQRHMADAAAFELLVRGEPLASPAASFAATTMPPRSTGYVTPGSGARSAWSRADASFYALPPPQPPQPHHTYAPGLFGVPPQFPSPPGTWFPNPAVAAGAMRQWQYPPSVPWHPAGAVTPSSYASGAFAQPLPRAPVQPLSTAAGFVPAPPSSRPSQPPWSSATRGASASAAGDGWAGTVTEDGFTYRVEPRHRRPSAAADTAGHGHQRRGRDRDRDYNLDGGGGQAHVRTSDQARASDHPHSDRARSDRARGENASGDAGATREAHHRVDAEPSAHSRRERHRAPTAGQDDVGAAAKRRRLAEQFAERVRQQAADEEAAQAERDAEQRRLDAGERQRRDARREERRRDHDERKRLRRASYAHAGPPDASRQLLFAADGVTPEARERRMPELAPASADAAAAATAAMRARQGVRAMTSSAAVGAASMVTAVAAATAGAAVVAPGSAGPLGRRRSLHADAMAALAVARRAAADGSTLVDAGSPERPTSTSAATAAEEVQAPAQEAQAPVRRRRSSVANMYVSAEPGDERTFGGVPSSPTLWSMPPPPARQLGTQLSRTALQQSAGRAAVGSIPAPLSLPRRGPPPALGGAAAELDVMQPLPLPLPLRLPTPPPSLAAALGLSSVHSMLPRGEHAFYVPPEVPPMSVIVGGVTSSSSDNTNTSFSSTAYPSSVSGDRRTRVAQSDSPRSRRGTVATVEALLSRHLSAALLCDDDAPPSPTQFPRLMARMLLPSPPQPVPTSAQSAPGSPAGASAAAERLNRSADANALDTSTSSSALSLSPSAAATHASRARIETWLESVLSAFEAQVRERVVDGAEATLDAVQAVMVHQEEELRTLRERLNTEAADDANGVAASACTQTSLQSPAGKEAGGPATLAELEFAMKLNRAEAAHRRNLAEISASYEAVIARLHRTIARRRAASRFATSGDSTQPTELAAVAAAVTRAEDMLVELRDGGPIDTARDYRSGTDESADSNAARVANAVQRLGPDAVLSAVVVAVSATSAASVDLSPSATAAQVLLRLAIQAGGSGVSAALSPTSLGRLGDGNASARIARVNELVAETTDAESASEMLTAARICSAAFAILADAHAAVQPTARGNLPTLSPALRPPPRTSPLRRAKATLYERPASSALQSPAEAGDDMSEMSAHAVVLRMLPRLTLNALNAGLWTPLHQQRSDAVTQLKRALAKVNAEASTVAAAAGTEAGVEPADNSDIDSDVDGNNEDAEAREIFIAAIDAVVSSEESRWAWVQSTLEQWRQRIDDVTGLSGRPPGPLTVPGDGATSDHVPLSSAAQAPDVSAGSQMFAELSSITLSHRPGRGGDVLRLHGRARSSTSDSLHLSDSVVTSPESSCMPHRDLGATPVPPRTPPSRLGREPRPAMQPQGGSAVRLGDLPRRSRPDAQPREDSQRRSRGRPRKSE